MVDIDKVKDKLGGKSEKNKNDTKSGGGQHREQQSKSSSSKKKEKTKKGMVDEFKGSGSSSGGGGTENIKSLLFTLANMDLAVRTLKQTDYDNGTRDKIKDSVCEDIIGEITNFLGVFEVPDVADRYGYSWDNVLRVATSNQDRTGSSLNTNSGSVRKSDVKDLLDATANIVLFVEGSYRNHEGEDNLTQREQIEKDIYETMYNYFTNILSENKIQRISEQNGYDWKSDILTGVMDQDFKELAGIEE